MAYKRRVKPRFYVIVVSLLLIIGLAVAIGCGVFDVKAVMVTGLTNYGEDAVAEMAGIPLGQNIFKADLKAAKDNIESNPYLVVKKISRKLPSTVQIEITERQGAAYLPYGTGYVLMDGEGLVLEVFNQPPVGQYLLIEGLDPVSVQVKEQIQCADTYQVHVLLSIFDQILDSPIRDDLVSVDVRDTQALALVTAEGTRVELGQDENWDKKMAWLEKTLTYLKENNLAGGTLDVRAPDSNASYMPKSSPMPLDTPGPDPSAPEGAAVPTTGPKEE